MRKEKEQRNCSVFGISNLMSDVILLKGECMPSWNLSFWTSAHVSSRIFQSAFLKLCCFSSSLTLLAFLVPVCPPHLSSLQGFGECCIFYSCWFPKAFEAPAVCISVVSLSTKRQHPGGFLSWALFFSVEKDSPATLSMKTLWRHWR